MVAIRLYKWSTQSSTIAMIAERNGPLLKQKQVRVLGQSSRVTRKRKGDKKAKKKGLMKGQGAAKKAERV